jgi:hypothetical protein
LASDRRDKKNRESGGHIGELFDDDSAIDEFFTPRRTRPPAAAAPPPARRRRSQPRPSHYKVISISLYTEDIERLQTLVDELKARGHTRASKSQIIREALRQLDLDAIPPQR